MDIALGYPMGSDDALWWQTFWTACSAIATFIAACVALGVGLLPVFLAAERDKQARRHAVETVREICFPALHELRSAIAMDMHIQSADAYAMLPIGSAVKELGRARETLRRFDSHWIGFSGWQLLVLTRIEFELDATLADLHPFTQPMIVTDKPIVFARIKPKLEMHQRLFNKAMEQIELRDAPNSGDDDDKS
jgi:hypothetical protein